MTATQRLGVLLMALPLSEVQRLAKLADQQGFENAWFPEITFSDAFIPVAAASVETSRIRLRAERLLQVRHGTHLPNGRLRNRT